MLTDAFGSSSMTCEEGARRLVEARSEFGIQEKSAERVCERTGQGFSRIRGGGMKRGS
jgi:hypothetical protein